MLDLLLPAFQAGIDMMQRMEAGRSAMIAVFDGGRDRVSFGIRTKAWSSTATESSSNSRPAIRAVAPCRSLWSVSHGCGRQPRWGVPSPRWTRATVAIGCRRAICRLV